MIRLKSVDRGHNKNNQEIIVTAGRRRRPFFPPFGLNDTNAGGRIPLSDIRRIPVDRVPLKRNGRGGKGKGGGGRSAEGKRARKRWIEVGTTPHASGRTVRREFSPVDIAEACVEVKPRRSKRAEREEEGIYTDATGAVTSLLH